MREVVFGIREALADSPAVFAASAAVVIFLALAIIIGAAGYIIYLYSPRGRVASLEVKRSSRSRRGWIDGFVVLLVLVLFAAGISIYARQPDTCRSCHQEKAYGEEFAETVHASTECMECHGEAGATAWAADTVNYLDWLWAAYAMDEVVKVGSGAEIEPRRCLACHGEVKSGVVVVDGVRVRHSDFIDKGFSCVACHSDTGHAEPRGVASQPVMNQCMRCHNEQQASADCDVCHELDLGESAVARSGTGMASVGIRNSGNCYECHEERPCLRCHGVTMPHPGGWNPPVPPDPYSGLSIATVGSGLAAGSHAREGFANREACWRCHHEPGEMFVASDAGCRCHGLLGSIHGGPAWVREHGLQATGAKPGAYSACEGCHGPPAQFCGACHPPSFAERYNPVYGPDNYSASPGFPRSDTFSGDE